jgi:hypothetical protein
MILEKITFFLGGGEEGPISQFPGYSVASRYVCNLSLRTVSHQLRDFF